MFRSHGCYWLAFHSQYLNVSSCGRSRSSCGATASVATLEEVPPSGTSARGQDLSGGEVDRTVCSVTVGQRAEGASPTLGTWRNTTQWERSMVTRVRSGTGSNSAAILSGVASRWAVAG